MNKTERLILFILAGINFTNIMDFMIMMPLGPQLMRIFGITPQEFGIMVSSYTISAGVSGFCAAFFIDRFDRKVFLQYLYVGFLIGTFACGFAPTYYALLAARVLTGVFGGVLGSVILSIVGDTIPFERRGQAMGIIMAAFSVASVFGVPFGLHIANMFDWHAPFIFLAILALPISFLVWKYIPAINTHLNTGKQVQFSQVLTNITSDPNQRKAITLMMVLMFGHFSIIPFLSPYMVSNVGFTEHQLTYIYLIGGAFNLFSGPLIGKLAIFVLICMVPVFAITNMPRVEIGIALIATTVFFIVSGGRFIPAQAMVSNTVKPEIRGSFMSITSAMQQLSAGLASYIAGLLIVKQDNGEMLNYNYVGYLSILAAFITLYLVTRIRSADGSKF
jgi:predicted MFS family arabinose efflux permease